LSSSMRPLPCSVFFPTRRSSDLYRGEDSFVYDSNLQSVFGFSLFFVIYTIGFNVISILNEKQQGVWDRVILSPVRKWQMYTANLDRKSTRLNSSHVKISYAVFCL